MENQNYKPEILIANDFKNIEIEKLELNKRKIYVKFIVKKEVMELVFLL